MAMHQETQSDLAGLLDVDQASISRRMRCKIDWQITELDLMAEHWNVSPSIFFEEPGEILTRVQNLKRSPRPDLRMMRGGGESGPSERPDMTIVR